MNANRKAASTNVIKCTAEQLVDSTVRWLKKLPASGRLQGESLLTVPFAQYFNRQGYEIFHEPDCYYLTDRSLNCKGFVNYDFYAEKGEGGDCERIVLEYKWMTVHTSFTTKNKLTFEKKGHAHDFSKTS